MSKGTTHSDTLGSFGAQASVNTRVSGMSPAGAGCGGRCPQAIDDPYCGPLGWTFIPRAPCRVGEEVFLVFYMVGSI